MRFSLAFAIGLFVGCYDPKSPNLPPCDPHATWPNPCAASLDAGAE